MTFDQFLQWLVAGGGSIAAVSFIFERMKWFQKLSSDGKDYAIFGAASVVGLSATAAIKYLPQATIEAITPFFIVVASIFGTVFIAKLFHRTDKPTPQAIITIVQEPVLEEPEPSGPV